MSGNGKGWIAVDLDGTLAQYDQWIGPGHIGEPVPLMLARVKGWLKEGKEVRIFTARVFPFNDVIYADTPRPSLATHIDNTRLDDAWLAVHSIRRWCYKHVERILPITNVKDFGMIEIWDDRAVQVEKNTGIAAVLIHLADFQPIQKEQS